MRQPVKHHLWPSDFRSSPKAHILPGPGNVSRSYPRQAHFTRFNPDTCVDVCRFEKARKTKEKCAIASIY